MTNTCTGWRSQLRSLEWSLSVVLVIGTLGCGGSASKEGAIPAAKVTNATPEGELTTVTLTPEAERRLGIELDTVARRTLDLTRELGGEVVAPPGRTVDVQAPLAGTVLEPVGGVVPQAGSVVTRSAVVLRLLALPPDRDVLRAEEEVRVAEARATLARSEATRFAAMSKQGVATAQELEQRQAELTAAEVALRAARSRLDYLAGKSTDVEESGLTPLTITAPVGGTIVKVHVAPGQLVAAGAALLTVVDLSEMWVKVPLYAGDAATIASGRAAVVRTLGGAGSTSRSARAVPPPPTADPTAAAIDLYFAIPNADGRLRPGQSVLVDLPLRGGAEPALVVPRSALAYDVNGGTWVYERTGDQVYARRRVDVRGMRGDLAILARGLREGATIVRTGVAELFGTEFGTGK